jgi:WD40 repeat protein
VVALAPDGRSLVTLQANGERGHLWEVASGALVSRAELPGAVGAAAFTPDGRRLFTTGGALVAWDLASAPPRVVSRTDGHRSYTYAPHVLDIARNGRLAATIGWFPNVRLWDLSGPSPRPRAAIEEVDKNRAIMGDVALSPDGTLVAVAMGQFGKALCLWRVTAEGLREIEAPEVEEATRLAFSPDGKTLAVSDGRAAIRVLDLTETVPSERLVLPGHPVQGWGRTVNSVSFDADGRRLLSTGRDGRVVVWDAASGGILNEWKLPGLVPHAVFAADGRHIATANGNGTVYVLRAGNLNAMDRAGKP